MILWFWYCVGNSSQVSDGAGAVLLMKRSVAMRKGLPILGVFRYESRDLFLLTSRVILLVAWKSS